MGIAQIPAASSGLSAVIKSLQRGSAASAGNITITSVDTTKTVVNSFSTGASGSVAATGVVNAVNGSTSGANGSTSAQSGSGSLSIFMGSSTVQGGNGVTTRVGGNYSFLPRYGESFGPFAGASANQSFNVNAMNIGMNAMNVAMNAANITGGSTNLTSAVNGAYLVNATTIYATGPCRYEVIEYF